jgi:HK97 family phage prohead protease
MRLSSGAGRGQHKGGAMERKAFTCAFDVKEVTEDGQFEGHAAVFNNVDLGGDRIKRGAFKRTLDESGGKWPVLMGHIMSRPVGFSTGGEEDSKGLLVRGEFTLGSDDGRNAYALAKHAAKLKQPFGLSIGYGVGKDGAKFNSDTGVRDLTDLDVYEFSLAAVPMNPRARVARVKSADEPLTEREIEDILRDAGFLHVEAKRLISSMKAKRDVEPETQAIAAKFHELINTAGVIYELTAGMEQLRHG